MDGEVPPVSTEEPLPYHDSRVSFAVGPDRTGEDKIYETGEWQAFSPACSKRNLLIELPLSFHSPSSGSIPANHPEPLRGGEKDMSILKILSDLDKATKTIDKISTMFDPKPAPPQKPPTIEEREKRVKARIKEKGLETMFRDIYPDL